MREIDYFELGATLYIPIMHKNLEAILSREKYPFLKSVVICLEDSTAESDVQKGMQILKTLLESFEVSELKVFVRARDIANLRTVLCFEGINKIDGFAISKFDTNNISEYLSIFIKANEFYLMPILETKDVFSNRKLHDILTELEPFKERILVMRVGGEDILSQLNSVRDCRKTMYEVMPLYIVLSSIINTFVPNGFHVSSVVNACFENVETLDRELQSDVEHQLFNKTSIHPKQIQQIHEYYKVNEDELFVAKKLLDEEDAIFSHNGRMYEKTTHSNWAKNIYKRYTNFGLKEEKSYAK